MRLTARSTAEGALELLGAKAAGMSSGRPHEVKRGIERMGPLLKAIFDTRAHPWLRRTWSVPMVANTASYDLNVAQLEALLAAFPGRDLALIREGGSIPIVQAFKDVLGADTLLLGLALPDCQAHAPNENIPIDNFIAGVRLNQALLAELA